MPAMLTPLSEQVIVITGASSGIGLTTARAAARAGARVVLGARNRRVLQAIVRDIEEEGGEALAVEVDVGDFDQVVQLGERAVARFGRIDTWVNNAGVSIYATLMNTPLDEHRQVFETNYWGVVHGSTVAVRHLRAEGGALINVGSIVSDHSVPLQGAYSASKHAVKGFIEALRMEIEHEGLPISVTLVKPGSIATPFPEHARVHTDHYPRLPRPVYAPELVANAILRAATSPARDVYVGTGARALDAISKAAPRLTDRLMEGTLFHAQQSDTPKNGRKDNLFTAGEDGQERTQADIHVSERSLYDSATARPGRTLLLGAAVAFGLALFIGSR